MFEFYKACHTSKLLLAPQLAVSDFFCKVHIWQILLHVSMYHRHSKHLGGFSPSFLKRNVNVLISMHTNYLQIVVSYF
jgi:hypothetical protein